MRLSVALGRGSTWDAVSTWALRGTARVFVQGPLPTAPIGYTIVLSIPIGLELVVLLTVLVVEIAAVDVVVVVVIVGPLLIVKADFDFWAMAESSPTL